MKSGSILKGIKKQMKFIDFHTHIYPEKIAGKATEYLRQFCNTNDEWPGTADVLLEKGRKAGVGKYVILPVAVRAVQVRKINDFSISQGLLHEEFICFGTVHAGQENIISELEYIKSSGLRGIKIHPDQQDFPMDDPRLFPAYDFLSQEKMPVLFHCGDPRSDFSHPLRLKKILHEFPELKITAAHFGGWRMFDEAVSILKNENCYYDMSSSMAYVPPEKIVEYINAYGADRIFFGSDFPLWEPSVEIEKFLALDISDEEKEKIVYVNAESFLGLK